MFASSQQSWAIYHQNILYCLTTFKPPPLFSPSGRTVHMSLHSGLSFPFYQLFLFSHPSILLADKVLVDPHSLGRVCTTGIQKLGMGNPMQMLLMPDLLGIPEIATRKRRRREESKSLPSGDMCHGGSDFDVEGQYSILCTLSGCWKTLQPEYSMRIPK